MLATTDNKIKHIFVLMLENRSFDHIFGFSNIIGKDAKTDQPTKINNLIDSTICYSNINPNDNSIINANDKNTPYQLTDANKDPGHEFSDVLINLCGKNIVNDKKQISKNGKLKLLGNYPNVDDSDKNSGFVANYQESGSDNAALIMKSFSEAQLPVLNVLAKEFVICDNWFSSIPGPTIPNRLFIHAASSAGLDSSPNDLEIILEYIDGFKFSNGTLFDLIKKNNLNWKVFSDEIAPQLLNLHGMYKNIPGNFHTIEDLKKIIHQTNFSSIYNFIEPNYSPIDNYKSGNSMHPLGDATKGEQLIKDVYETIRNSPIWERSALIILFDEHGGFYDHVFPPSTVPPGDKPLPGLNKHNFQFDQLGVRVPAIIISPWIKQNIVDHTLYDHTSVIATMRKLFHLGNPLTNRDAFANDFSHLFSLTNPRSNTPLSLPNPALSKTSTNISTQNQNKSLLPIPTASLYGFVHAVLQRILAIIPNFMHEKLIEKFRNTLLCDKEGIPKFMQFANILVSIYS